jgi:2-polyprenyl-6-methoxyphenol hydroxylase-like FAD-dependent oxidoreductase
MRSDQAQFRVIIAGGGIAGLSLALSLQHAGINYILLEARDEFAPQLGASIGLGPNGSRILDQLGCYDEILQSTVPIEYTGSHRDSDGAFIRPKTDAFRLVQARSNYSMCFLDRQKVLHILAKHIKDHDKLHLRKRIIHAEECQDGVKVSCNDGTFYEGQVLVGADGVHSTVRREMWRVAEGRIPRDDRVRMAAEYRCLYAISAPIPGLPSQEFDVTYKKDVSPIVITGKDDRVYWFLIERLAKTYPYGEIPRYTKDDAHDFVAKHFEIALMPDAKVTVRDLWQSRETFSLVPLEEGFLDHWTFGRFVCLGDSVHKMTPNLGSGGNSAIESAASLANELRALLVQYRSPDTPVAADEVHHALSNYQRTRATRASATFKASKYITRLHAMRGPFEYVLAHYLMPRAGDLLTDLASDSWIGAVRLDFLPVPLRSLHGTMPFNPEQGLGKNESLIGRALFAMPMLALSFFTSTKENLTARVSHSPRLVAYFGTLYGIMLLESTRRANALLPMQWYCSLLPNSIAMSLTVLLQASCNWNHLCASWSRESHTCVLLFTLCFDSYLSIPRQRSSTYRLSLFRICTTNDASTVVLPIVTQLVES